MAWMERIRAVGMASALVLLGTAACSEDKPSDSGGKTRGDDGDDGDSDGLDQGGEESDDPPKEAGSRMDAKVSVPETKPDAGDAGAPVITLPDSGGAKPPATKPDAAVINNALTPLPHDGERGSICYGDGDCSGDDLKCLLPQGSAIPGFCVDDCAASADCKAIDGVKGSCSNGDLPFSNGICEYPCGGPKNDGKGTCPKDMVCENLTPANPLIPDWQCRYPAGGGKKTEKPFTKCDNAHEGGDCEGLSWCAKPALNVASAIVPHGYCSPVCTKDADCKGADEGTTAKPYCDLLTGSCLFDCSVAGARCPIGMNCRDIDPSQAILTERCIFVD